MDRFITGAAAAALLALPCGAADAQGFSGSGAAGYSQSQGWTASAGVQPRGAPAASTLRTGRDADPRAPSRGARPRPPRRGAVDG